MKNMYKQPLEKFDTQLKSNNLCYEKYFILSLFSLKKYKQHSIKIFFSILTFIILTLLYGCQVNHIGFLSENTANTTDNNNTILSENIINIIDITTDSIEIQWKLKLATETTAENMIYEIYISQNRLMKTYDDIKSNGALVTTLANLTDSIATYSISGLDESTTYYINIIVSDSNMNCSCYNMIATTTYSSSPTQLRASITQYNITWYFDKEYNCGQFANGDWWVVGNPVNIIYIDPPSLSSGGRITNGSMFNPSPTNGFNQGYDNLPPDSSVYQADLNVAYNVNDSNPLVLEAGSSLVSMISWEESHRFTQMKSASILTVLDAAPAEGSFRPPYSGNDKIIRFNKNQLDYSLLEKLDPVSGTPTLAEVAGYFERPWIDHVTSHVGRALHPSDNMPNYGADMSSQIGAAALMLHLNFSDTEKETLLIRFVQLGIDLYGIVQAGGEWEPDGGHANGRKWPILFAGLILGNDDMSNIGQNSGDYLYSGTYGPGNNPPEYISFGEDSQTFYVTQDDVDRTQSPQWDPDERLGSGVPYENSDIGLAEWGISHSTDGYQDNKAWSAIYRQCCTAGSWTGQVLAARIMGVQNLWNHDALFDYQDRYMSTETDWRTTGFVGNMWDIYRSSY